MNVVKRIQDFSSMVRISHTVFALPFALAALLVASGGMPSLKDFLLVLLCMVSARNSAMTFNRIADAAYDAANPRTAGRHLPAGRINAKSAQFFLVGNGIVFLLAASGLNSLAGWLALPTWLLLLSYSLWKRFSWLCHWYLGLVIGLSPLGAWVAVTGEIAWFPAALGVFLMLWMAGFDIVYSLQDEEVDRNLGLHSVPARFGSHRARQIALGSHAAMLAWDAAMGFYWNLGFAWWVQFVLVAVVLGWLHLRRIHGSLDSMNAAFFLANAAISTLVLLALLLTVWHGAILPL